MRRDPTLAIVSALRRDRGGVAIIYFADLEARDWLVDEVTSLLQAGAPPRIVSDFEACLIEPHVPCLVVTADERTLIEEMDGGRDRILEAGRTQPIVLFLLRDGDGVGALRTSPSLASWVRGSDPDPDQLAERFGTSEEDFLKEFGATPRHDAVRATWDPGQMRKRLVALTGEPSVAHRFTYRKSGRRREWFLRAHNDGTPEGTICVERAGLASAKLTLLALTERRQVLQFTTALELVRPDNSTHVVAVHLDPEPRGAGMCSHAVLHAHVGPSYELEHARALRRGVPSRCP